MEYRDLIATIVAIFIIAAVIVYGIWTRHR